MLVVPVEKKHLVQGIEQRAVKGGPMDGQSESSRQRSENTFKGGFGSGYNGSQFDNDAITEERANVHPSDIPDASVPYLSKDTDEFTDCFRFGTLEVMIPFDRLD